MNMYPICCWGNDPFESVTNWPNFIKHRQTLIENIESDETSPNNDRKPWHTKRTSVSVSLLDNVKISLKAIFNLVFVGFQSLFAHMHLSNIHSQEKRMHAFDFVDLLSVSSLWFSRWKHKQKHAQRAFSSLILGTTWSQRGFWDGAKSCQTSAFTGSRTSYSSFVTTCFHWVTQRTHEHVKPNQYQLLHKCSGKTWDVHGLHGEWDEKLPIFPSIIIYSNNYIHFS